MLSRLPPDMMIPCVSPVARILHRRGAIRSSHFSPMPSAAQDDESAFLGSLGFGRGVPGLLPRIELYPEEIRAVGQGGALIVEPVPGDLDLALAVERLQGPDQAPGDGVDAE